LFEDDGFRCSDKHCRLEMHENNTDYVDYNSNDDCDACKESCRYNVSCGGVQCGKGVGCNLWKVDVCGDLYKQQRENASYRTCMKYDEGNPRVLRITHETSNNTYVLKPFTV